MDSSEPLQRFFPDSDALCRYVCERSDGKVLLSFSRGKHSSASLVQLRRHRFTDIIPFFFQAGPKLRFVEESLSYYEEVLGRPIIRLPHPSMQRMLKEGVCQPPERLYLCEAFDDMRKVTPPMMEDYLRRKLGMPDAFSAVGNRASDTPVRRASINKNGSLTPDRRSFLPIYDWTRSRVADEIEASGIKLPIDYEMFGRSWDGIQFAFIEPLRRRYPDDYARLLQWFPLADADKARRVFQARENARKVTP